MPTPVFDAQTMQPVQPAPEDIAAGFASGKYGFDASAGKVLLKGEDGTIYHATPDKAAKFIASGKYSLPTADEELEHRISKEEEAKGVTGSLAQGAESALNQATFGVEEAVARGGLSPEQLKERELRQQQHTVARVGGGALGVGASMLYGGEAFKAASLAGEAASHLIVPAEDLARAGLAARTAAKAADFAAQGVALSAPQALAQAAFGDPEQAAETLLWGIGAGAPLGAGAELLGSASRALGRVGSEAIQGEGGALDKFANTQALRSAGGQKAQLKKFGESGIADLGGMLHEEGLIRPGMTREEIGEAITSRKAEAGQTIGDTIKSLDGIFTESNGYKVGKAVEAAAAPAERVRRTGPEIGEYLRDNPEAAKELASSGKLPVAAEFKMSEAEAPKPTAHFATSTDAAIDAAIKPGGMGNAIREAFDIPEMRMEMNSAQANAIAMIARDADRLGTKLVNGHEIVSFDDAQNFVSALRDKWKASIGRAASERGGGIKMMTPLDEAKADAYQVARDFLHKAADETALASDRPELMNALADAKQKYAKLAKLEEMAANFRAQDAGNKFVSLTDQIHAGQGMASGATSAIGAGLGAAVAGPAGAVIGHAIGKAAGIPLDFIAKKWFENKGLIYLSTIAKKAAKDGPDVFSAVIGKESQLRLDATMKGVGDTVRKMALTGIESTAARTQEHMKMLLGSTTGLTPDQSYSKLENRVNTLASNPAALAHVAAALSSPFITTAPQVAAAYQQKIADSVAYLHQSLPKAPGPPAPFAPQTWSPSATDKLAFHDKAEIVANPMRAMQHMAQGTLSDAHLDALRSMYPQTYGRMQSEVLTFAAEHPEVKLPLAERASVAKFLGAPLDQLTSPDTIRSLQSVYGATAQKPNGGGPSGRPLAAGKLKKLPGSPPTFQQTMSGSVGEGRT
jgi:hypothetical protein